MTRCACWMMRASSVLARRSIGLLVLLLLNPLHIIFHGTPLDGGALDGFIQMANAWAINEVHR